MNTETFQRMLYSTVLPSSLPSSNQNYEELMAYVRSIIPKKLFRFRRCKGRHVDDFYNDKFGVATGIHMNDGFDTRLFFDRASAEKWIESFLNTLTDSKAVESLRGLSPIANPSRSLDRKINDVIRSIPNMPTEFIVAKMKEVQNQLQTDLETATQLFAEATQRTVQFASLCASVKSATMWGHYAADETGFALEYDFTAGAENICQSCPKKVDTCHFNKLYRVFPIIYGTERYRVSNAFIQYLLQCEVFAVASNNSADPELKAFFASCSQTVPCPDLLEPTKIALHKSLDWSYEEEWRVFFSLDFPYPRDIQYDHFYKKPTALYLGRRIDPTDRKNLLDIAKEKGLPVYQMTLNDSSATYELIAAPVTSQNETSEIDVKTAEPN